MKNSKIARFVITLILTVCMTVTVFASGSSTNRFPDFHVNGWTYQGSISVITEDEMFVEARTWIYTACGRSVNPGIIGAEVRLYDDRGFMIDIMPMEMNRTIASGLGLGLYYYSPRAQNRERRFYAIGSVCVLNVSTGVIVNRPSVRTLGSVPRNLAGLPMEERLYYEFNIALATNGMIPAVAINGLDGWVYANDLQPYITVGLADGESYKMVNVYAADGTTVIGYFKISPADVVYK